MHIKCDDMLKNAQDINDRTYPKAKTATATETATVKRLQILPRYEWI